MANCRRRTGSGILDQRFQHSHFHILHSEDPFHAGTKEIERQRTKTICRSYKIFRTTIVTSPDYITWRDTDIFRLFDRSVTTRLLLNDPERECENAWAALWRSRCRCPRRNSNRSAICSKNKTIMYRHWRSRYLGRMLVHFIFVIILPGFSNDLPVYGKYGCVQCTHSFTRTRSGADTGCHAGTNCQCLYDDYLWIATGCFMAGRDGC